MCSGKVVCRKRVAGTVAVQDMMGQDRVRQGRTVGGQGEMGQDWVRWG